MSFLQLQCLRKSFTNTPAVHNLSLTLEQGQILCLLGPSGCGKTTLLRLIAGLEKPDLGRIICEGYNISAVPPHQRDFGLMFQEFALFPHKNVGQNVAFGLQMKQQFEIEPRVTDMLTLVGLTGFEDRDVNTLSGGERQRVALARSLAPKPRLLMLDEPLGALDRALRQHLMSEIRQILKAVGLTAIYVTHDQTEAFAVADRIVVMNEGYIEQDATPEQLYYRPSTPFVARFLGFNNLIETTRLPNNHLKTALCLEKYADNQNMLLLIRPEAASIQPFPKSIKLEGTLITTSFRGRFYQLTISVNEQQLTFEMPLLHLPPVGSKITLWLDPSAINLLPQGTP